jgi:hypothetical protein
VQKPGEPMMTFVEKQLVASTERSGTTPKQLLVCNSGRLATQLQSTIGIAFVAAIAVHKNSAAKSNCDSICFFIIPFRFPVPAALNCVFCF